MATRFGQKLTPWYPANVKPCRLGWYIRRIPKGQMFEGPIGSAYWDGLFWFKDYKGHKPHQHALSLWQDCEWRGLNKPFDAGGAGK